MQADRQRGTERQIQNDRYRKTEYRKTDTKRHIQKDRYTKTYTKSELQRDRERQCTPD